MQTWATKTTKKETKGISNPSTLKATKNNNKKKNVKDCTFYLGGNKRPSDVDEKKNRLKSCSENK